ncbi:MAG: hypothetical protein OEZ08_18365, partial [Betaproteobacteria bacterium]|nr:hypothetical protein [Betaproteobacteria bacterium]
MKRKLIAAAAAAVFATASWAQMGPGMMGGHGPGGGQGYGQGPGYGPGYGPGPGMGPGMMGGYGGHGMGPGMMGGYGGYGMGPGMMGGYGGHHMGPGMMGGHGGYGYGVDLSPEQRAKIADIQWEIGRKQWDLMEKMHEEGGPMYQVFGSGAFDEKAARKGYEAMADAHKQM